MKFEEILLNTYILENSLLNIILFIVILSGGFMFKRLGAHVLSKQSFRMVKTFSSNQFSEVFVELLKKPLESFLLLLMVYMAFDRLTIPSAWPLAPASEYGLRWLILKIWQLMFLISIARILLRSIDFFTHVLIYRSESPVTVELANFLKELIKVVMMILCIFAGLRLIFSVDITALVASLGIGGLAVALAAQDTLANLLGSFIIYLDKPFKVGDNIEAGDIKGVVEHVGFRSTKIRTVEKSLLTVPNKKLIDTPLNNITQTEAKRVSLIVGLNYTTTSAQVLAIVADLKETLNNHPDILPDFTVKFTDLNTVSINITVIYFVKGNDSSKMLTVKEQINVDILSIVEKHGAEFAQQNNNR